MRLSFAFVRELRGAALWATAAIGFSISAFTVNSLLPQSYQQTFPAVVYWAMFVIFPALAFSAGLIKSIYSLVPEVSEENPIGNDVFEVLFYDIKQAHADGRWGEVLRIGEVLSRPLWILGKLRLRAEIGRYVEAAASHLGRLEVQARTLIDDLGWTYFELGDTKKATKNITAGKALANRGGYHDLEYKASRHLSGIALFEGDAENGKRLLDENKRLIAQIDDSKKHTEAEAGWQTNYGILLLLDDARGGEAEQAFRSALRMYNDLGDQDRAVKLSSYIGDALATQRKTQEAKDEYRKGITESVREGRLDAEMRCQFGLGALLFDSEKDKNAHDHLKRAREIAEELGNKRLKDVAQKYLDMIE